MKAIDLTPRMIGQHIRVTGDKIQAEGRLNGYELNYSEVGYLGYSKPVRELGSMTVEIDSHILFLTGREECAIVKGDE